MPVTLKNWVLMAWMAAALSACSMMPEEPAEAIGWMNIKLNFATDVVETAYDTGQLDPEDALKYIGTLRDLNSAYRAVVHGYAVNDNEDGVWALHRRVRVVLAELVRAGLIEPEDV